MHANGFIRKVESNCIEFEVSLEDEEEVRAPSIYEKSKIKYINGPAPVKLIVEETPIFVEFKDGKIKDIFLIVDLKLGIFYGKINEYRSENEVLVGFDPFIFAVNLDHFSKYDRDYFMNTLPENRYFWFQVFTVDNRSVLEVKIIREGDVINTQLEDFNKNIQGIEETEYFVFKDKNLASHFLHRNFVYYKSLYQNLETNHVKDIIGTSSKIYISNWHVIAEVMADPRDYVYENSDFHQLDSRSSVIVKTYSCKKIENQITSIPKNEYEAPHSSIEFNFNTIQENHYRKIFYYFQKFQNSDPKKYRIISEVYIAPEFFYVNDYLFSIRAQDRCEIMLLIGMFEHYCRTINACKDMPLINDIDHILASRGMASYIPLMNYIKNIITANNEIDVKLSSLYECVFSNFVFFNYLSKWIINQVVDYYELANRYEIVFEVYFKTEEGIHKTIYRPLSFNQENQNMNVIIYDDKNQLLNLYDNFQMIVDGYLHQYYSNYTNSQRYEYCEPNFHDFLKQSLEFINAKSNIKILEHYDHHIEIIRKEYCLKKEDHFRDLYFEAISRRYEYFKSIFS